MSDLKCPFCQQKLEIGGVDGILRGCPKCRNLGTEMLWQELINERQHATDCQDLFIAATAQKLEIETELERTRKALDVAEDALIGIEEGADDLYIAQVTAEDAMNEIHKIIHGGKDG